MDERAASRPQKQFEAQVKEERKQIWYADPRTRRFSCRIIDRTFEEDAREAVKNRWIEQGMWKNKWDNTANGLWKHEEPLELESESETDTEAASYLVLFLLRRRRGRNRDRQRAITKGSGLQSDELYGSGNVRPHVHIISSSIRYRKSASEFKTNPPVRKVRTLPISTRGRTKISRIPGQGERFGTEDGVYCLPGMSWKHEELLEEEAANDPAPIPANPLVNSSHDAGGAPAIRIFGSPSPIVSNYRQVPDALNLSQQRPPADIDSARSENGDAKALYLYLYVESTTPQFRETGPSSYDGAGIAAKQWKGLP